MSRVPFLALVAAVTVASFFWLVARGRPMRGGSGVEPVLYVSGLHQPRALAVGADGALYVAEAGWSGAGQPVVPGRVSRVSGREQSQVVLDGLPAAGGAQPLFAQSGPAALASEGAGLAVLLGPEDGQPLGSVLRLPLSPSDAGPARPVVLDGSAAPRAAAPWGAQPMPGGPLATAFPLANLLVRLDTATGRATPVTPFIAAGGANPLPAGVARAPEGQLLVAHFGAEPYAAAGQPATGRLVQVLADGRWQPAVESLRFPVAAAFAPNGLLFVLELATGYDARGERFLPRSGRVLALGPEPNRRRVVVRDVDYPTAIAFSPAGDLYITEAGLFRGPGEGRVLFVPAQTLRVPG